MSLVGLRGITSSSDWRRAAESIVAGKPHAAFSTSDFATYWIEAGHRIREQIADDLLLSKLLRLALPKYQGKAVTLFRGENVDRWRAGLPGFAWTNQLEVARMFGRGLNAVHAGGVLLRATFEPISIIAGPNEHSQYFGEAQFTVDPRFALGAEEIEVFPSQ